MKQKNNAEKGIKALIRGYLPDAQSIKNNKYLKIFGKLLIDPNLWHLNRYSVATGFSVGLFVTFLPIFGQMPVAALFAIIFRANLPISLALTWLSNPFTSPVMFYFGYVIGAKLLSMPLIPVDFELSIEFLFSHMHALYLPMLLGTTLCGLVSAVLVNVIIRLYWRYRTSKAWKTRGQKK